MDNRNHCNILLSSCTHLIILTCTVSEICDVAIPLLRIDFMHGQIWKMYCRRDLPLGPNGTLDRDCRFAKWSGFLCLQLVFLPESWGSTFPLLYCYMVWNYCRVVAWLEKINIIRIYLLTKFMNGIYEKNNVWLDVGLTQNDRNEIYES